MERIDRILSHPTFRTALTELEVLESLRSFCHHDLTHLLDVARLMRIISDEEGIAVSRELIYAAALLHDIGRAEQYRRGTPHAQASMKIADPILIDCGFDEEERAQILAAIGAHSKGGDPAVLSELLFRADKRSRACFACKAADQCDWTEEEKNLSLEY